MRVGLPHAALVAASVAVLGVVALWCARQRDDVSPLAALALERPVAKYDLAYWGRIAREDAALWQRARAACADASPTAVNCRSVVAAAALLQIEGKP